MQRAQLLLLALTATLAACASNTPATSVILGDTSHTATSPVEQAAPTAQASPPAPPTMPGPMPAPVTTHATVSGTSTGSNNSRPKAALSGGFATRHAYYEPLAFADLPGWDTDDVTASWEAFRRSCTVLGARSGWSEPCNAARAVDVGDVAATRRFFETYFNAYQIRNPDRSLDGTMTGYYEPLLNGSQQYGGAYLYPVYGTPADMLYLDARRLPDRARGDVSAARIDGRNVIPLSDTTSGDLKGVYALDLRDSVPDIRDKKIRLRLDGGRIVPYYSRAEIERGALKAPILAYVDDPVMLYSMQLQGAGKVRMSDGSIRRFAYAEQNGRPFLPPLAHSGNATAGARKLVVRGMEIEVDISDDGAPATSNEGNAAPADGDDDEPTSPLLRGFTLATTTPTTAGGHGAGNATGAGTDAHASNPPKPHPVYAVSDPSYVFFRVIPDSPNGPLGALGVPLSAGRSVAVDPRTTPLGAPVFVSTRDDPQAPGAINRLMLAQDSGGAIQGAVRADYFYGFGQTAQTQASRTKERLRMWVLLPKGLRIAAQQTSLKTRGGGPAASDADCLVSDPVLCVDDAP
ncbi:murein transglycosylase A [Paraburkholderia sp. MM5384-R2]|uniref:murein transglycosylase A n=1 Tax=Paraburkholderia sp. MM5384-R2 TaxID=2723097 RepID=UPI001618E670|nr:MltA domain-containing protein [Paraburkholderia sp. MM5384-R2]MBB5502363.1 membrane-bound lytic murein transglycosylase A [Paraburkholderia sp. MM5384-R2]